MQGGKIDYKDSNTLSLGDGGTHFSNTGVQTHVFCEDSERACPVLHGNHKLTQLDLSPNLGITVSMMIFRTLRHSTCNLKCLMVGTVCNSPLGLSSAL